MNLPGESEKSRVTIPEGPGLGAYKPVVGHQVIEQLRILGGRLAGRRIQHINSTSSGGGVAEILVRLVPLMQELGLKTRWDVMEGNERFFEVTKKVHNALHGKLSRFRRNDLRTFLETNSQNARTLPLESDVTFIHDPQPAALISEKQRHRNRWVWRCHVDVSSPQTEAWRFLRRFVDQYDAAIFSAPQFAQVLPIRQFLIAPSIDPLSAKNQDLPPQQVDAIMDRLQIPRDKPLVTQVSRFDALKDPAGVIEAFRLVKRSVDCRLLLAGGGASDDPEGSRVLGEIKTRAKEMPDVHILELPPHSDIEINAIQRASTVIVQKSIREGFALTVTEALWKAKPVVASAVGGIPLQITHKFSGMLCRSIEGAAFAIKQCLNSPSFARRLGENGQEHIRQNFLLTRHLRDYLLLMIALEREGDVINI